MIIIYNDQLNNEQIDYLKITLINSSYETYDHNLSFIKYLCLCKHGFTIVYTNCDQPNLGYTTYFQYSESFIQLFHMFLDLDENKDDYTINDIMDKMLVIESNGGEC